MEAITPVYPVKPILFLLSVLFLLAGCQPAAGPSLPKMEEKYDLALSYGDYGVATSTVYDILHAYPEEKEWRDTLMLLYFKRKTWPQAILVAEDILEDKPNDEQVLGVLANAYQNIRNGEEAIGFFRKLYDANQRIIHLYEVANAQYNLGRVAECRVTVEALLNHPDSETENIELRFNRKTQRVPYKAAALNLLGILEKELKNKEKAEKYFKDALKVYPSFELAKGNLQALLEGE